MKRNLFVNIMKNLKINILCSIHWCTRDSRLPKDKIAWRRRILPAGLEVRNTLQKAPLQSTRLICTTSCLLPTKKSRVWHLINANYAYDKAALTKIDPMFARNQFSDVGHADGSGNITERDLEKSAYIKIEEKKYSIRRGNNKFRWFECAF